MLFYYIKLTEPSSATELEAELMTSYKIGFCLLYIEGSAQLALRLRFRT